MLGRRRLACRADVLVGGHGERRGGVAEPLRHHLDWHPIAELQRDVGVAQVVEPDRPHHEPVLGPLEGLRRHIGLQRLSVGAGEHQAVAVRSGPGWQGGGLALPPASEQGGGCVEGDAAAAVLGLQSGQRGGAAAVTRA